MMNKIDLNVSVPVEKWGEFFDRFSIGNLGRHISIENMDPELGDRELIKNAPLLAMIYDRPGKGDNLQIEVGKEQMTYGHTIESPTEVSTGQNSNGEIIAMCIASAAGRKTLVKLEPR
ncbi:MAG: ADP-ribose pyrophosphatase [Pseudanabaena frigida]|uniref:ADP-ribose pyrophosphatase n=1 Tax=Pseudanabaena frigida TaxID=945775 RepID=A0A2W4XY12_9CYAN|nr:MAG: ADP-ribose pyrophosphatase [Pseudanabaena frigida]